MEPVSGLDSAAIVSGFTTAANDTIGLITDLLPIALTVFVAMWGIRKAQQFFKRTAN